MMAQTEANPLITYSVDDISAENFLKEIEAKYKVEFRYKYEWITDLQLSIKSNNEPLQQLIKRVFESRGLTILYKPPNYFVMMKNSPVILNLDAQEAQKNEGVISLGEIDYQSDYATVSGKIISGEKNDVLPGVTIEALENNIGTVSNAQGKYNLKLPIGFHTVKFQSLETGVLEISIVLNSNSNLNLKLYRDFIQLDEVIVTAKALDDNVSETITGAERISLTDIEKLPAFLGEADVIKSITSLPGVSLTGEASAGFNVRGSGVGANLVLLDNGTIFNSSHLFGVFSAFSADNISTIDLYKGTVPAQFGGRIASVLNIEMKSGSKEQVHGNGGVGAISSRFNVETPIVKGKSSILTGFRVAYPNYLMNAINDFDLKQSNTFFGDWTIKYDHTIDERNQILGTAYVSNDQFSTSSNVGYTYNNLVGSLQWNHVFNENLTSKLNYNYSQYNYGLDEQLNEQLSYSLNSVIESNKLDYNFEFTKLENHLIHFGLNNTLHKIQPGNFEVDKNVSLLEINDLSKEFAIESAIYASDKIKLNEKTSFYAGLRYSYFNGGKASLKSPHGGLEPRFSLNYSLNRRSAIKVGASRMRQYIHLISNTASVTPVDIWKLSNQEINPTIADQFSFGYFRNFNNNNYETSAELYYRKISNLIDYKDGADLFGNDFLEDELVQGDGTAFGLELYLKKHRGKATGWLSYTYSRSLITVQGETLSETINNGDPFPTNFDQPHNLTVFGNMQLSRRFEVSFNFLYNTGRPITYPETAYNVYGVLVANYSGRNKYRIPDYHRLDLSFHLASSLKKRKLVAANWTLTIYNVYSRRNAYSIFFRSSESLRVLNSYRLSIIGQAVPTLTYNFKF